MYHIQNVITYLLPALAASMIFVGISEIMLKIRKERISWFHRIITIVLGLYLSVVFALTLSSGITLNIPMSENDINLIPLQVFRTVSVNPLNFYGNILMFVPFGLLLVLHSDRYKNLLFTLSAGAGLSLFIELLQLFGIRSTDIDDVILNTAGTLCGYIIGRVVIFLAPSIRDRIGVSIMSGEKRRKKRNPGSITVLTLFVLASFFLSDYTKIDYKADRSIAEQNPAMLEQVPEVNAAKAISAEISAKNAYLWNISSNMVLYDKESDQRIAPASTAKMLTALTALEFCEEDEEVLVGSEVRLIAEDASRAWLMPGCKLTVRQLLDALLVPSGNDAAYALAAYTGRKICGDEDISIEDAVSAFVEEMNQKAVRVGAVHSEFKNPDGYDSEGQFTTAYDLAHIAKAFYETGILNEIAGRSRVYDRWLSGQQVTLHNTNELILPESQYYYEHATGLKTGRSEAAGCCLVSSANIEGEWYIGIVMGSTEEGRWTDSLTLYRSIEKHP